MEGLESGISYEDDDESPDEEESDEDEEECAGKESDSSESVDEKIEPGEADEKAPIQKSDPMKVDKHRKIPETSDGFMHDAKSLDDPTASSKDIANVLMMLSQEPVNHDINNPKHTGFEKSSEVLGGKEASNSYQTAGENLGDLDVNPSEDALEAVTALNTMKANCETKADVTSVSSLSKSFTADIGHKSDEVERNSFERPNLNCDRNSYENQQKNNTEDSVIAAAKAIAAKAVASTSHILFPSKYAF